MLRRVEVGDDTRHPRTYVAFGFAEATTLLGPIADMVLKLPARTHTRG